MLLVVILAIWIVQSSLEKKRITGRTIDNFLELNPADINRIAVITKSDTLSLQFDRGLWYLGGDTPRRTDSMAVRNMLSAAVDMKIGNVISQNPEKQQDFAVDSTDGIFAEFYRDDRLLSSIIIGKMANDYAHTYVRKPGSDEVYLAEGLLTYVFNRQRTQWLDKTIFSFVPGSVASVEFMYADRSYRLSVHDTISYIARSPYRDSIIADSAKAATFLNQLTRLNANDFVNASDSGLIDFSEFSLTLNVTLADNTTSTLNFSRVNEESSRVYCRIPGYDETFVIYQSRYQNLKKDFSSFLP